MLVGTVDRSSPRVVVTPPLIRVTEKVWRTSRLASVSEVIGPLLYRNDETPPLPDCSLVWNRNW